MDMQLTEQQELLFEFVKQKHADQKRKYTHEPYYNHLLNVAATVSKYESGCVEIALCHDLYEDTNCNFTELYRKMTSIGYTFVFSYSVCTKVYELTDKFTSEEYPYLKRAIRKQNEANRLAKVSYEAQSVKYADLIDNTGSIVEHDKKFAQVYLKEKEAILRVMDKGNQELFELCKSVLAEANKQLNSLSV